MHDVVILGGGPGGYAAALYAHHFDLSVALVERDKVGGTCLHRGCIPAKSWLQSAEVFTTVRDAKDFGVMVDGSTFDWPTALSRKDRVVSQLHRGLAGLLKQRKVEVVGGEGRLDGPNKVVVDTGEGERELEGRTLVVATGSVPRSIPGYQTDGERIVNSAHALDWSERPSRVAIIGAGAIGCEFASLLIDLGSEVHLFELLDQVVPGADPEAARALEKALAKRGVQVRTGVEVGAPEVGDTSVRVPFGEDSVEVDTVLVAVGRAPVTDGIGLETTKVEVERGFVKADLASMQTAQPGVYAVGDVVAGTPQLAHAGFAEGMAAITHIATGETAPVTYRAVPLVVYTHPEMATVGLSEAQAKEEGYQVTTTTHGLAGVGRAMIVGQTEGLVKVVAEQDGPILGASIVGPWAGEMIHELMYAVGWEALPQEAAAFVHAHPTLSEAVGETLLSASGRSLH
ncbi:MAG: dihydrolipoyl dehydrogenase [Actinomycetota bacterium]|nr:dihydrolipoyl dehydrogenase [Actinomycetota bacterium]